eukprot:1969581-Lingulodinium_polyedra.AAC.1
MPPASGPRSQPDVRRECNPPWPAHRPPCCSGAELRASAAADRGGPLPRAGRRGCCEAPGS